MQEGCSDLYTIHWPLSQKLPLPHLVRCAYFLVQSRRMRAPQICKSIYDDSYSWLCGWWVSYNKLHSKSSQNSTTTHVRLAASLCSCIVLILVHISRSFCFSWVGGEVETFSNGRILSAICLTHKKSTISAYVCRYCCLCV